LRDPDCRIEAIDDLKFISLWGDAYMSLGGEARIRYERYTNSGFGSDPPTDSGYVLERGSCSTSFLSRPAPLRRF
jgi:hypothetical protein